MEHQVSFYPLLIVVLLAFVTPLVLARIPRLRIPVVVGEIIAGMIFGKSGLNLIQPDPWLELLSTLGFAYLMFLSGLEIDLRALGAAPIRAKGGLLRRALAIPAVAGAVMFALTFALAAAAGFGITASGLTRDPWIVALILSTTSLGIVVPVLKERELLGQSYGQAILIASLIADFVTMLAISVYVVILTRGLSLDVLLVLVLLAAGLAAYRAAGVIRRRRRGRFMANLANATAQVPARGALTLALVFIGLAESLGVEIILGAFIAGAIVALLAEGAGDDLLHKLDAMGYAFFVPIFFINVGATFDLAALLAQRATLLLVPLLLVIAYAVKLIPSLVFSVGFGARAALALGLLTSSRLSLIIAASAIGLDIGAISSATNAAIVLVAIVTCTLSPLLFGRFAPPPPPRREGMLIVGDSTVAQVLVQQLRAHAVPLRQMRTEELREHGLQEAHVASVQAVAALTSEDETNLVICEAARRMGVPVVTAQVQRAQYSGAFRAIGAHPVNPALAAAAVFEGLLTHPTALSLLTEQADGMALREVVVANPALNGRPLRDLRLPHEALIVMIAREGERLIARGDTRLRLGDLVTLVGSAGALDEAGQIIRAPALPAEPRLLGGEGR